jgi:sugar O-acyltransferase (sialic acid O-acetyltransferase NeuD family)
LRPGENLFLVWGGGGHGRVVADVARAGGATVVGFIDRDAAKVGLRISPSGDSIVLEEAVFLDRVMAGRGLPYSATCVALGIGDNAQRSRCRGRLDEALLPPIVHPASTVSSSARIGLGAVVMANVVVNAGASIGDGAILNTACVIEHDCVIGDDAHVSPGAILAGAVKVGAGAWVGAGATVIPGLSVGEWAVVGAGAVVIRDVPPGVTVVGNPARAITRKQ